MTTQHLQMAKAMVALLLLDPPIAGGRIYRARTRPIGSDAPNGVVVRLERSASQLGSVLGARTSWSTLIAVECYARIDGDAPDAAADPIVEAVFERLASDPSLGGVAMDTEPLEGDTLSWDFDEFENKLACVTAKFLVRHQTTGRTLT
jgi:hypothetical protein